MRRLYATTRRDFIGGAVALGTLGVTGCAGISSGGGTVGRLPAQGEYLVRDAYVMTMEPGLGDLPGAHVHVRAGRIVAVGAAVEAPGAQVVDGRGMIVLPGLVETHWHMWNTLLRGMSGEKPDFGYFRTSGGLGRVFEPGDMYQGTRLAAAEALSSGITFVHDWCHNIRGPEFA